MSWPERYRRALEEAAGVPVALDDEHADAVLDLARVVAHGSERRYAPLATFLAGQFVVTRVEAGQSVAAALAEAQTLAEGMLP